MDISSDKTWTWLRKRHLKRETESFLKAAQNDAIKTMSRQEYTRRNKKSRCRLCGDTEKTINHIISECSKLVQREYKTRHDWVVKVIHWELCKKKKKEI